MDIDLRNTIYDTADLSLIMGVFEEVWGSKFLSKIHAIPAYPRESERFKAPCRIYKVGGKKYQQVLGKDAYKVSPSWKGFYPGMGRTIKRILAMDSSQYLLGLFDSQIACVDFDDIYDTATGEAVDLSVPEEREKMREVIKTEIHKICNRFIIEDSTRGFHLFFWCPSKSHYTERGKYCVIGFRYICKYDIISCHPEDIEFRVKNKKVKANRPVGGYTLLGYGKEIPNYKIERVGGGNSLDKIPWQFYSANNYFNNFATAKASFKYQEALGDSARRERVKNRIFFESYLKKQKSFKEEMAMEAMITRVIRAEDYVASQCASHGFVRNEAGEVVSFEKLKPDAPMNVIDEVKRTTIDAVYAYFDYLNTLPVGISFSKESLLEEFFRFCYRTDREPRGLYDNMTGKPLTSTRFYKIIRSRSRNEANSRIAEINGITKVIRPLPEAPSPAVSANADISAQANDRQNSGTEQTECACEQNKQAYTQNAENGQGNANEPALETEAYSAGDEADGCSECENAEYSEDCQENIDFPKQEEPYVWVPPETMEERLRRESAELHGCAGATHTVPVPAARSVAESYRLMQVALDFIRGTNEPVCCGCRYPP